MRKHDSGRDDVNKNHLFKAAAMATVPHRRVVASARLLSGRSNRTTLTIHHLARVFLPYASVCGPGRAVSSHVYIRFSNLKKKIHANDRPAAV